MRWKIFFFSITCLFFVHSYSQEQTENSFNFKWDKGFKLESNDKQFSLDFGGQIFLDHGYFFQDNDLDLHFGPLENKSRTEFRSARLFLSGQVYGNTEFKFQLEFAGEEVSFKDFYIGIKDIPAIGNLRIGHFNEPFRFSSLSSGKYTTLMERAPNNSFASKRNTGAVIFNDFFNKKLSAQLGAFHNASNISNNVLTSDGYAITGRVTTLPYVNTDKAQLLHLGISSSYRKPDSNIYNVSISPSSSLAEKYLQTGEISDLEEAILLNFELVYLHGPFSFQAEYLNAGINTKQQNINSSSVYGQVSWFLTGEQKNYLGSYDGLGRVSPKRNFGGKEKGAGAWEVAARYSRTDLSDYIEFGGVQSEIVFGVNWYLNPVTRFMLNYAHTNVEDLGSLNYLQGRLQIDF